MFVNLSMRRILLSILFATSLFAKDIIAVLDLETIGLTPEEAKILTQRLTTKLISLDKYQVVERTNMDKILKEQKFQKSGCTDSECAVEIGQLLNTDFIVIGSVSKFGSMYSIDARLIDVAEGKSLISAEFSRIGEIEVLMSTGITLIANQLCGNNQTNATKDQSNIGFDLKAEKQNVIILESSREHDASDQKIIISSKNLWYDGPFQLKQGMLNYSIPIKYRLKLWEDRGMGGNNKVGTSLKVKYGLMNNLQVSFLVPLVIRWEDWYGAFGTGISNLKLEGLYSWNINNEDVNIDTNNTHFSSGIIYSIPTDDGWWKDEDNDGDNLEMPASNGYKTLTLLVSYGYKKVKSFVFTEFKYNINGERDNYYGAYYDPSNNYELNFVGSYIINSRTKIRSEINFNNDYSPIDENWYGDNKKKMILLRSSIHKLMKESLIWNIELLAPLLNEYDYKYFGFQMGFTWIN